MARVVIPTCGESPYLLSLIESQSGPGCFVDVIINNMEYRAAHALAMECRRAGASVTIDLEMDSIYRAWWMAAMVARQEGQSLAVLNDDIALPKDSVMQMESIMRANPQFGVLGWDYWHPDLNRFDRIRPVEGSFRQGGIGGFAFMLRPDTGARPDYNFGWWGGDDDLFHQVRSGGFRLGVAMGLGVQHWPSTSSQQRPEVLARIDADWQLLFSKWGEAW